MAKVFYQISLFFEDIIIKNKDFNYNIFYIFSQSFPIINWRSLFFWQLPLKELPLTKSKVNS